MKERITYSEIYKQDGMKIKANSIPELHHLNKNFICVEASMLEQGIVDRDGRRLEYQIIKVYCDEVKE